MSQALEISRATALRLLVAMLSWGYVRVLVDGVRFAVVSVLEPGGSGIFTSILGGQGGQSWTIAFLVVTVVQAVAQAALLGWALRPTLFSDESPWPLALVGVGGLGGSAMSLGLNTWLGHWLSGARGVEALASYSIATSISNFLHTGLMGLIMLGALVYLTLQRP